MHTEAIPATEEETQFADSPVINIPNGASVSFVISGDADGLRTNEAVTIGYVVDGVFFRLNTAQFAGGRFIQGPFNQNAIQGPLDVVVRKTATPGRSIAVGYYA